MSRIVSVWLPRWPILRFLTAQARHARHHEVLPVDGERKSPSESAVLPLAMGEGADRAGAKSADRNRPDASASLIDPRRPFVLTVEATGGPRVVALNAAAEAEGLAAGEHLADARAKAAMLQVRDADPTADAAALRRLALWATRYTPAVAPWIEENGADGLFLDVAGSAHLFGGEEKLVADLAERLACFGLPARLAIAATPGAAWALARFHAGSPLVLPAGKEAQALAPLPIEALRLSAQSAAALRRLGFRRVGALLDKPREPFAARFPAELLLRIDQALGRASEPLVPVIPPPVYHSLRYLLEPIVTQAAVVALASRLMGNLVHVLVRDGVGARALRLALYRVDGAVKTLDLGLALPTRDPAHVARLIELRLEALAEKLDAGFGFEAVGLAVTDAQSMPARQMELGSQTQELSAGNEADRAERCARLLDVLIQRLGPDRVRRIAPVESHIPERAERTEAVCGATDAPPWPVPQEAQPRPLLLFPRAEQAEVIAVVPEGPPQRFRWRGQMHSVTVAQGPERIAHEWWRHRSALPTRDYYLVEDQAGRRFWLYREGLYGRETAAPRWFVHGLFA